MEETQRQFLERMASMKRLRDLAREMREEPSDDEDSPVREIEMKPCPFCGHEPQWWEDGASRVPFKGTQDLTWGCESGAGCPAELSEPVTVEVWNRRSFN